MKGQKLFVRPASAEDLQDLTRFYERERLEVSPDLLGSTGAVAKLAGELVAHAAFRNEAGVCRIDHLYVARELRGLRIGRGFLGELLAAARSSGCSSVSIRPGCPAAVFFHASGFVEREGFLQKSLSD